MITTATCKHCDRTFQVSDMHKIESNAKNYFYVCNDCNRKMYSYSSENHKFARSGAKHGLTCSFEWETSKRDDKSNWLYEFDFMPTEDCTVTCEWKSPIYTNIRGHMKMFRSMESKLEVGNGCGTHTNIGTFTTEEMNYIRRFYQSLFVELSDYMLSNREKTIALFGRDFTHYASPITRNSNPMEHVNIINVQHDTHLEFRLCKFINANQFMNCLKFCIDVTKTVKNNFIDNFNKTGLSNAELKEYRLHKAQVTANKLIKVFDKYTSQF